MKESADNLILEPFAEFKYLANTNRIKANLGRHTSITFRPPMRQMLGISHQRHPLRNATDSTIQWQSAKACDLHRGFTSCTSIAMFWSTFRSAITRILYFVSYKSLAKVVIECKRFTTSRPTYHCNRKTVTRSK